MTDRHEDEPRRPETTGALEGVRILGAEEAQVARDGGRAEIDAPGNEVSSAPPVTPAATTTSPSEPAPTPAVASPTPVASAPLPHWTEPPTGEMPAVFGDDPLGEGDDDLEVWASVAGTGPRFRTNAGDWDEGGLGSVEELRDDDAAVGALAPIVDDDDEFDAEVAARRRPVRETATRQTRRPRPAVPSDDEPVYAGRTPGSGRDLPTALVTGLAIAVLALAAFSVGRGATAILAAVVAGVGTIELYEGLRRQGHHPAAVLGILGSMGLVGAAYETGTAAFPLVIVLVFVFSLLWYLAEVVRARPVVNIGVTMLGFLFVGLPAGFAGLILTFRDGIGLLLGVIICVIAYDTVGYFVGSRFGRTPIAPRVSPNKTVEGTIAGMIASIILAVLVVHRIAPWDGNLSDALLLGVVVAVMAPLGDLCESMLKRDLGVKDLGSLLPGHGGVLDRFDGVLFCLPAAYYLAIFLFT